MPRAAMFSRTAPAAALIVALAGTLGAGQPGDPAKQPKPGDPAKQPKPSQPAPPPIPERGNPVEPVAPPRPPAPPAKGDTPQPGSGKDMPTKEQMEEMMKQAMDPGPVNAKLQKLVGTWEVATHMEGGGAPAEDTKGTETIVGSLGGRFIQENGQGMMMGMPVSSFKMWGYNNGSKKYEAVWAWTVSTGFLHMSGTSKDDGKTIDWEASFDNEVGIKEEFKATTTIADDDHFSVKLFGGKMPDGTPGPTMSSQYTRKK